MTVDSFASQGASAPPNPASATPNQAQPPSPAWAPRRFLRRQWAILLPAFVYLYIFPYLPGLRSPNELSRLLQSRALVDRGSIEIGEELTVHGSVGDLSCVAVARGADGRVQERHGCPKTRPDPRFPEQHYYPSKAPLLSFAAAPVYGALKLLHGQVPELALIFFARLVCIILPSIFLLVLIRRYLGTVARPALADLLTVAYALGTLAFSYSELFLSHQPTAVMAFACFYALWRLRRGEWPSWTYAVIGLLAGLIVACEYTGALALIPLGVYGAATARGGRRDKLGAAVLALAGLLPPAIALAAYHQAAFGNPLYTGYRYLLDAGYQWWHTGGLFGIKLPSLTAFGHSFFSPLRGLFTLSPMLVLALPRLFDPRALRTRDPELLLSLAMFVLYTYFTSSFSHLSWGWSTGPRHLTPLVPFLLLPMALAFRSLPAGAPADSRAAGWWWQVGATGVVLALVVLSILTTSVMTMLNYISHAFTNALYQVALPLALRGFLPHNWLSLVGVRNPWAALPAVAAIVAAAVACAVILLRGLPRVRRLPAAGIALACAVLVICVHTSFRPRKPERIDDVQRAALFMETVYSPQPGHASPRLWRP
jgi:hypothetical protein